MRVLVIGNCQAPGFAACLQVLRPDWRVHQTSLGQLEKVDFSLTPEAWSFDRIFAQPTAAALLNRAGGALTGAVTWVPRIVHRGFHPDMIFARAGNRHLGGATGPYHSALALFGFGRGLDVEATLALFRTDVFRALGYFDAWEDATAQLLAEGRRVGLPLEGAITSWRRRGCFMTAIVQPRLFVLADVARALLRREGLTVAVDDAEPFVHDQLKDEAGWAVYPDVAGALGVPGGYAFKAPGKGPPRLADLRTFVARSHDLYKRVPRGTLVSPGFDEARMARAIAQSAASSTAATRSTAHPYKRVPDRQRWKWAVSEAGDDGPDPATSAPFRLEPGQRIATAGSCFAQHLAPALARRGFPRFVVETADGEPSPYPARYGNVYTARQLRQLIEWALDCFSPVSEVWQRADGRFVDPLRPTVEPRGFASPEEVITARAAHRVAVRRMLQELDVLAFTLGLTEAWMNVEDGAVLPLAPGVAGGNYDPQRHSFVNFTTTEVEDDLRAAIDGLRSLNRRARVILTVSPVPLAATFEAQHVLVATTASKAVLRAAAHAISSEIDDVGYFPAYEIVHDLAARGLGFGPDRRQVSAFAVARVVDLFLRHWTTAAAVVDGQPPDPAFVVICDEDRLEAN